MARLSDEFFQLRSGVAGAVLQRFVMYRIRVVVVGDLSHHTEASSTLADFVVESNRGGQVWFLPTMDAVEARLAALATGHLS